jgi:hypothetical protein
LPKNTKDGAFSFKDDAFYIIDGVRNTVDNAFCFINRVFYSDDEAKSSNVESNCFKFLNLSWNNARARAAFEGSFGEKAFVVALHTFPADVFFFVRRTDKNVVMLHFAITFGASRGRFVHLFRVDFGNHFVFLLKRRTLSL